MTPQFYDDALNRSSLGGNGTSSMTHPTSNKRGKRREWICSLLVVLFMLLPQASNSARQHQPHHSRNQKSGASPAVLRRGRRAQLSEWSTACHLCPNDGNLMCRGPTWGDQCNPCANGQLYWPCNIPDECVCQDAIGNVVEPEDLINPNTNEDEVSTPVVAMTESPSKHPTINVPEDEPEIVPIRFDVFGLSQDAISMELLRKELKLVTTRVILRLAESIEDLKISKVEERAGGITDNPDGGKSMYFNIYVIRSENKKFTPLIVQAIRDSHAEVVQQINTFTDLNYFTEYVSVNICAMQNGAYDACAKEEPAPPPPASLVIPPPSINTPSATLVSETDTEIDEGLSGGAISIIVIFVLLFVCCVGYAIAVVCFGVANCFDDCFRDRDDAKQAHDNMFWDEISRNDRNRDDRSRGGKSRGGKSRGDKSRVSRQGSRMLAIEDGRSPGDSRAIVLATSQDHPSFDDDSLTLNTYGTRKKVSRDPTMYIPGQEDKPDPDSESRWSDVSSSRREYYEDRSFKSRREPTMYVDGKSCDGDLTLPVMRDPTMYIDGHQETDMHAIDDSTVEEVHNDYNGIDKHYGRPTHDPSYYDSMARFDENRSIKSARSQQSTKSKKSSRGVSEDVSKNSTRGINKDMQKSTQSADWNASSGNFIDSDFDFIYQSTKRASLRASLISVYNDSASINDNHANSFPDGGARDGVEDIRQTKSFYK